MTEPHTLGRRACQLEPDQESGWARFYASAGRLTRARGLLAADEANDRTLARTAGPERTWTRGVIALAEGRTADAESELRQAADGLVCPICALPDLARAYDAARKPDAAVVVYERYLATPWLWRYEPDAPELGWAMKRAAELYDARGETATAAAMRGRLLQLWRRAGPELQPVRCRGARPTAGLSEPRGRKGQRSRDAAAYRADGQGGPLPWPDLLASCA